MKTSTHVSVVICTRNRAASLVRTLAHLEQQAFADFTMEVIVVDNGSVDETSEILRLKRDNLNLIPLFDGVPGKSRSLNLALTRITGELILFTDDDVSFGQDWVGTYVRASYQFPDCVLYCGPIIPEFPPGTPPWLGTHEWSAPFFGTFNEQLPEGLLPLEFVPLGGNFAVRAKAIAGMQFRTDLGPSQANGKLMGEDVEFSRRVRDTWHDCVYVPSAPVRHHIRTEQITPQWLCDRAFVFGRSVMVLKNAVTLPRFTRNDSALDKRGCHLDQACLIHFYCGQLIACTGKNEIAVALLTQALGALDVGRYGAMLTPEASAALAPSGIPTERI